MGTMALWSSWMVVANATATPDGQYDDNDDDHHGGDNADQYGQNGVDNDLFDAPWVSSTAQARPSLLLLLLHANAPSSGC